ncbi:hypothetical protein ACH5RR_012666 [Cinchona calisaya]|uniref:Uncharacterized protein n=1 Tax=Cinchona calisaya TaxID=153742 RepID=A0ABD3ABT2_9GENT
MDNNDVHDDTLVARVCTDVNQDKVSAEVPSGDLFPATNHGVSLVERTKQEGDKAPQNLEKNQEDHIPDSILNSDDFQETVAPELNNFTEK